MESKVVILGAGHVGSHVAYALAERNICRELVLVDILPDKAKAQAMDVTDSLDERLGSMVIRAGDYADCADAAITVCAIGKPREPGQTRLDLLGDSVRMVRTLAEQLKPHGVGGLLISITNPCDIIADCLRNALGLERFRCFGTGTLLDTARLRRILSEQCGAKGCDIEAYALGEHGDSSMIPCSALRIGGKPAVELEGIDPEDALRRTHSIGMDIIEGKGSTEFGIGRATATLIHAIFTDSRETHPLSVGLTGEYGISGINAGVPCVVGRNGIERIVELPLNAEERDALQRSADVIRKHTEFAYSLK